MSIGDTIKEIATEVPEILVAQVSPKSLKKVPFVKKRIKKSGHLASKSPSKLVTKSNEPEKLEVEPQIRPKKRIPEIQQSKSETEIMVTEVSEKHPNMRISRAASNDKPAEKTDYSENELDELAVNLVSIALQNVKKLIISDFQEILAELAAEETDEGEFSVFK